MSEEGPETKILTIRVLWLKGYPNPIVALQSLLFFCRELDHATATVDTKVKWPIYFEFSLPVIGEDLQAPSLGGTEKNSQTKISEWRFLGNNFHFSLLKFLITFFSHRPCFHIFPIVFLIFHVFTVCSVIIWPFLHEKNPYFLK